MIFIPTNRPIKSVQLLAELQAAGVPATQCFVTTEYMPRSVAVDVGTTWYYAALDVVEAHSPEPDTLNIRIDELKRERRRRLDTIADDPDQIRLLYKLVLILNKKIDGDPLTPSDLATRDEVLAVRAACDAVDDAAKSIYQQLQAMTDAELESYDVATAPEWP